MFEAHMCIHVKFSLDYQVYVSEGAIVTYTIHAFSPYVNSSSYHVVQQMVDGVTYTIMNNK